MTPHNANNPKLMELIEGRADHRIIGDMCEELGDREYV